jgi:hypothetical protein
VVVQDNRVVRLTATSRAEAVKVIAGGAALWARAGEKDVGHSDARVIKSDPNTPFNGLGQNPTSNLDTDDVPTKTPQITVARRKDKDKQQRLI